MDKKVLGRIVFIYVLAAIIPALLLSFATGLEFLDVYAGILGLKFLINILISGTNIGNSNG
jgi:hypothetical protein